MRNNGIRVAGTTNRNCAARLVHESMLRAVVGKILLQQYLPRADIGSVSRGVINDLVAAKLLTIAVATFFKERSYQTLLQVSRKQGIDVDVLEAWLPQGKVDRKKADAEELLRHMESHIGAGSLEKKLKFEFVRTSNWLDLKAMIDREQTIETSEGI